jgi:ammonia channel protein AmtB
MDIGLSSVTWYIVGYAFAYGGDFNAGHESSVFLGDE